MPSNPYAERVLLGSALLKGGNMELLAGSLESHHFSTQKHRLIFQRMLDLYLTGIPVDRVTLAEKLISQQELEQVDGLTYLASLDEGLPEIYHLDSYVDIVREKAALRQAIYAAQMAMQRAFEQTTPASAIVADLSTDLQAAINQQLGSAIPTAEQIVMDYPGGCNAFLERQANRGLSTGFKKLDRLTNGWKPGELHVLAARPAMGKTALAMGIAVNVAVRGQKPVAVISLEMSRENLLERAMCSRAGVDLGAFNRGELLPDDRRSLSHALSEICTSPLFMDDRAVQSIPHLLSKLRRLQSEAGQLALIVVDYIQLMESSRYEGNRVQEVSQISRGLKLMSKELACPVLALSQLSRGVENRDDKRPKLADLRESGSIEQDADSVAFIYRPEVYHPDRDDLRGVAELILAKQRNGPTGTMDLTFEGRYTRFTEAVERYGS